MLVSLALPILLAGIALFFASFVSWMVVKLHKDDWRKMPGEDGVLSALRAAAAPPGSYMVPGCNHPSEMHTEEHQRKMKEGPVAVLTIMPPVNMGTNLGLTLVYFLIVSFFLAYLSTIALKPGTDFLHVFQFVFTAALPMFLAAMVQHSIWFKNRIVGHVIESVFYAAIVGAIFAGMWPAT